MRTTFANRLTPEEELARQGERQPRALQQAIMEYARAKASGQGVTDAYQQLWDVLTEGMIFADLLGRRRLRLELEGQDQRGSFALRGPDEPSIRGISAAGLDLLRRNPELAETAELVAEVYRRYGFAVLRAADIAITNRVQRVMASLLAEGVTGAEVTEAIAVIGDWGQAYSQTVYRTNYVTAYNAGRQQEAFNPQLDGLIAGWVVVGSNDADTRGNSPDDTENHVGALGLMASVRDSVWATHTPPYGYNCRHTIRAITTAEAEQRGLLDVNGVMRRVEPAGFAQFRPHPRFAQSPFRRIYG